MDDRLGDHAAIGELPDPRGYPRVAPDLAHETALQQDAVLGVQIQGGPRSQVLVLEEVEDALHAEVQDPALALSRGLIELATQRGWRCHPQDVALSREGRSRGSTTRSPPVGEGVCAVAGSPSVNSWTLTGAARPPLSWPKYTV